MLDIRQTCKTSEYGLNIEIAAENVALSGNTRLFK